MHDSFDINDYSYQLPEEKIALYPLKDREQSKLLIWKKGEISHHKFYNLTEFLPNNSLLVFNNTKVIAARIIFHKDSGAKIEIFLLHPEYPSRDISESMKQTGTTTWSCLIGNKKKWKGEPLSLNIHGTTLTATIADKDKNYVTFNWTTEETFASIIENAGQTPLPPYLKRELTDEDKPRYQTVYSKSEGAVAAPTAGLHFSEPLLENIKKKGMQTEYLTLHVSAGTFKPVEAIDYRDHEMHREQMIIYKEAIKNLLLNAGNIIAVGTTSLRTLESLYWYGRKLIKDKTATFFIEKEYPYQFHKKISFEASLEAILKHMDEMQIQELRGETEIFIYPGYQCLSAKGLITNFHLSKSTLLLLVASFSKGNWKNIYEAALKNDYRFLSYGDSSLILP